MKGCNEGLMELWGAWEGPGTRGTAVSVWAIGSRCAGEGVVTGGYGIVVVQEEGMGWVGVGWGGVGIWYVFNNFNFLCSKSLDLQLLNNSFL